MARQSFLLLHLTTWSLFCTLRALSQSTISTDTPVPPLQWINLSALLQGASRPPPLKNAAIGYDETSRSMIIFGGESESGLVQSQTFLLNLDTLTWSVPNPPPNLQQSPAARTNTVAGVDSAASNRQGFVVIGGKGSSGKALSDIWEFDFNNQFWSEVNVVPGGPFPRWGASGGIDIFTPPIQDPVVPGPNNTFYLVGGYDGTHLASFSDVWRLNISGTLSSNLPSDTKGSWDQITIGHLPSKFNQSGLVINHQVILTGGCHSLTADSACVEQDSYIVDAQQRSEATFRGCPAPRKNPVFVRNASRFTSIFGTQVHMLLGTFDKTKWDDDNGLETGEIAILDIQTGTWTRIRPSGDPGTSGTSKFPSPREGSSAFSYPQALVGQSRNQSSDTIVFGGQDSSGNLLSEVWLLRAYNGIVTSSQTTWSGFGDGRLQSGINANGAGVRVTFMTKCASKISTPNSTGSAPRPSPTKSTTPHFPQDPQVTKQFQSSTAHKILTPVSFAIFQAAFLLLRLGHPFYQTETSRPLSAFGSAILGFLSFGLALAGLVTSFTSLTVQNAIVTPAVHLQTGHGIAGLVLFVLLYISAPALLGIHTCFVFRRTPVQDFESEKTDIGRVASPEAAETYDWPSSRSMPNSLQNAPSSPSSPRYRANSWGPSGAIRQSREGRLSSDSESIRSPSPKRTFEVVNRPSRLRKQSDSWLAVPYSERSSERLRDIDWLQRRRSLNAVGELDFALTQVRREQMSSTPATADGLVATQTPATSQRRHPFPPILEAVQHLAIQGLFLATSIFTITALWLRAPKAAFAVFLAWTVLFYIIMAAFAWNFQPTRSVLVSIRSRLGSSVPSTSPDIVRPTSIAETSPGPYVHHQPPVRLAAPGSDDISLFHTARRSIETDGQEDDIDDDTRQRMIENEMARRDVSIVTVPKRKLWIANP